MKSKFFIYCLLGFIVFSNTLLFSQDEPDSPRIHSLSVHNGHVNIVWERLSDTSVAEYKVLYGVISGTVDIITWIEVADLGFFGPNDTVASFPHTPPYLRPSVDVTTDAVPFAIRARNSSGIVSIPDIHDWDSTILLRGSFDPCLAQVELSWNPYDFNLWPYNAMEQVIFISENGGAFEFYERIGASLSSYQIRDLVANNTYHIYVGAVANNNLSDTSFSIPVEVETGMARLPEYMHADYATYASGNAGLSFSIDPNSEIETYEILRSNSIDGDYESLIRLPAENNVITYTDAINYAAGPYFYKLDAINFCDENIRTSENVASTIVLNIQGETLEPELNWNGYQNWLNGVSNYRIDRKIGDEEYSTLTSITDTVFIDNSLTSLVETGRAAKVCYNITALENNNPYGSDAESQSNEYCIELPVNIRFEYDGFMPGGGANNTFGPVMDFVPDFIDYKIVDRGGQVMFSSTDPDNLLWDGTYNGNFVNQGAYMYVLKYKVGDGKNKTLRGGFVVANP